MRAWVLLFAVAFLAPAAAAESDEFARVARLDGLDRLIKDEMSRDKVPGLTAVILQGDRVVWQESYGYRDVESKKKPDENTIYLTASLSKTIVAVAAMQLYESGKLGLDADINSYLPFPVRNIHHPEVPITARHLLTHTSGLANPRREIPLFYRVYAGDSAPPLAYWLRRTLIPEEKGYKAAVWKKHAPGTEIVSSNVGMALLGYLVEVISGEDFGAYCTQNIFKPLGMASTGHRLKDLDADRLATLYENPEKPIDAYSFPFYPAVMVRSTAHDMGRFLAAIMNEGALEETRILKAETVREMLTERHPPTTNLPFNAGLAWVWRSHGPKGWMGHTGVAVGGSATMELQPEQRVALLLLSNATRRKSLFPGGAIFGALRNEAEQYFEPEVESVPAAKEPEASRP